MIIILKELRIEQLCSKNEQTEIKTKSADVFLKMIIILKEPRIAQLCSQNEWTKTKKYILLECTKVESLQCQWSNKYPIMDEKCQRNMCFRFFAISHFSTSSSLFFFYHFLWLNAFSKQLICDNYGWNFTVFLQKLWVNYIYVNYI